MSAELDLIVLGAGPAGVAAAVRARALGLSVAVLDEAAEAGGQVHRARAAALRTGATDPERREGEALRARLAASGAQVLAGMRVWSVLPGFRVAGVAPEGPVELRAPALIAAHGALERHLPIPGWTLPGVIGLAAGTVLLKAEGVLPGRRVVLGGSGPLLYLVAAHILAAGGTVAAVVDAASRGTWLRAAGGMLARPGLAAKGLGWMLAIRRARVPIFHRSAILGFRGTERLAAAEIGALDPQGRPHGGVRAVAEADAACIGFGLMPATEVTRLLGAAHDFVPELGGWAPRLDEHFAASVPGLFVAGDAAGVRGAAAAPLSGELAALGVARHLGRDGGAAPERLRARWRRAARFGTAMSRLAMPAPALLALARPDTVLCRCEALPRAALEAAITAGARTLDDLKATTRCGMGACGGRFCGEAAAMLLAGRTGATRAALGQMTARPPLRPVPLSALAGTLDYEALPIPAPAPL